MNIDFAGILLASIVHTIGVLWAAIIANPWTLSLIVGIAVLSVLGNVLTPRRRRSRR